MNQRTLLLILTGFFLFSFASAQVKSDLQKDNLKGNIKSLTQPCDGYSHSRKGSSLTKEIILYNNKGFKTEWSDYHADGSIDNKRIYKYDEKGNITEYYIVRADGSITDKRNYLYDSKGNLIQENYSEKPDTSDYSSHKNIYKYDDKGNQIEFVRHHKSKYFADLKFSYKYDDKGNQIEENEYIMDDDGYQRATRTSTYNDKNKLIKYINSYFGTSDAPELSKSETYYKYDTKGNLIEEYELYRGHLFYRLTYKYDDKDNCIEDIKTDADGISIIWKTTCKYDYDKTGNWIKKTNLSDNSITERVIEYY